MRILAIAMLMVALAISSTATFAARTWDGSVEPDWASITTYDAWMFNYDGLGHTRMYNLSSEAYLRFGGGDELIRANGWFVEMRLKVTEPTSLNWNAAMVMGDDVGGGVYLVFSSTQIQGYENDTNATKFIVNWNASDWNVVRLTMPAGGTIDTPVEVRVNNVLVGSMTAKVRNSFWNDKVNIGDATGSAGTADVAWDYLNINYENPTALTGNITLEDYAGDLDAAPVKIEMVPVIDGFGRTEKITLAANTNGAYSVTNVIPGTYDVYFSACKWQKVKVSNVAILTGPVDVSPTLKNGDADGDNEITSTDLSVVLKNVQ